LIGELTRLPTSLQALHFLDFASPWFDLASALWECHDTNADSAFQSAGGLTMTPVKGVVKNGQVVLDEPYDVPDGTPVEVVPTDPRFTFGIEEDDWDDTPEGIEAWLRWFDALEPLEMTAEEEAELQAWRRKVKEYHVANFDKWADGLEKLFK